MSKTGASEDNEMMASLDLHPQGNRKLWWLWLPAGLLLVGLLVFWRWNALKTSQEVQYKTAQAQIGNLTLLVTATGNLEPTNQVLVGIEVSGTIKSVEVDHNDQVKAGQVLARLDTGKLEARILQSNAALESAKARLLQARASFREASQVLERLRLIRQSSAGRLPSIHDFDAAEAALKRAEADKALSEASIAEAKAKLQIDKIDLEKSVVLSPIDGVVLKRSAEPGQTVAASFQSPELFSLAENLTQMDLQVNVDEADVGQVASGQAATFTVDAYPERIFPASITQVRYGSQASAGVVTYPTLLNVDNADLALRPGMTATADIVVKDIHDALLVPNAALRFTPARQEAKEGRAAGGSLVSKLFPRRPQTARSSGRSAVSGRDQQQVWILRDNKPVAVAVTVGDTDGMLSEIISGEIAPGTELIVEASSGGSSKGR
ncbi:MAG: efflux RND transporter periplasmic adaptor subunit [Desulfoarculaceae bacterium]|nr:efflux RND transporter periplasmic adaptor subunit [Desulfoarculaceae bacterium]